MSVTAGKRIEVVFELRILYQNNSVLSDNKVFITSHCAIQYRSLYGTTTWSSLTDLDIEHLWN